MQDCLATIPPYPHYIGDRDGHYDVAAAISDPDSMWIVRPQLFFSCTLRPLSAQPGWIATIIRRMTYPPTWCFSAPLRTFACASLAPWSQTESESFMSPPLYLLSTLAKLKTFLVEFHYFHASLTATPPPPFHTSTLLDRVRTYTGNLDVPMGLPRDLKRAEAAMYMRSTLGCGTLDGPNLELPVSPLLKR